MNNFNTLIKLINNLYKEYYIKFINYYEKSKEI